MAPSRRRVVLVAVAITIALISAVALVRPRALVRYHRAQMIHFGTDPNPNSVPPSRYPRWIERLLPVLVDQRTSFERYESHRDRLVELGAIAKMKFTCRHLQTGTDEGRHFVHWCIARSGPPMVDYMSPHADPTKPPEPLEPTIWCEWEHEAAWHRTLAERDVPDYRSRFMKAIGESSQPTRSPSTP